MVEWLEKPLGELTSYIAKGIPPKYTEEFNGDSIYVLNQKCNRDFTVSYEQARLHDSAVKSVPDDKMVRPGDVLINSTGEGTAGRVAQIWDVPHPTTTDGHVILMRPTAEIDPLYYGYAIKAFQSRIETLAEGSTGQTEINKRRLQDEIIISYPTDLEVQHKAAQILERIDKKIQVNKAINDNLQQQLETLYHEMYPYQPSDDLPEGWSCVSLGELCSSISVKHSFKKDELIFLNTGDVENGKLLHNNYSSVENMPGQAKKSIKQNDILYSEIRPVNRHFAFVSFPADDYVVSTKLMVIRPKRIDPYRLYHYLTSKEVIDELQLEAESRSGTFPQIRFDNVQRIPIIIAPKEIEARFSETLQWGYKKMEENVEEMNKLTLIRDALLPRLMSGDVDMASIDI